MRGFAARIGLVMAAVVASSVIAPRPIAAVDIDIVRTSSVDSNHPSISADGRWVVFSGFVRDRMSVFRTDRDLNLTFEISPLPVGARSGDTIHPVLSADGCVVVAITEVGYDLFRDNDRDERWDVYRLVLPECGGQPNAWELVSSSDRTGTAFDGVFTDSPPAVSGAGERIAYVHQAAARPAGVGTISIIDITVPINEPGRVSQVAGMPIEAPNRAFTYRGANQPAFSQNGRHLAFVSDTAASDALPGWGEGPVIGEKATRQVFVWDRLAEDQRRAVHLVSGRNEIHSAAGGADPVMSEDGRIVVFASRDRTIVPAQSPRCTDLCPTQIYRYDRDTDGNGIFDEPPRTSPLAIVSAIDAGKVSLALPEAGNASSWAPAVNADGSQAAFVTDATNLLASRRSGGGGTLDGDLLVAEVHLGQIRRVLNDADLTAVPGAHSNPALSKSGQVIVFDTMAAGPITGARRVSLQTRRTVVAVEAQPRLSLASLDFGTVLLGFQSAELFATVRNAGPAAFEPTSVTSSLSNFKITGGTCTRGVIVAAGTSCSVNLIFTATLPRGFSGELTVTGRGENAPVISTSLRGAAGEPTLLANPGGVDLDGGIVGSRAGRVAVDIDNVGFVPTSIARIAVGGENPDDFEIVTQSCTNRALNPDASCAIEVEFVPKSDGFRSALLIVTTPIGQYTTAVLGGLARYEPTFVTAEPLVRSGQEFGVGGNGFPAETTVSIGFEDGGEPFATVETTREGAFLAVITMPGRVRSGIRGLVATAAGGAVANAEVDIEARRTLAIPSVPGFGLG
jgi:Tol biopolymer transport system component